jgi:hypothetical protein
MERKKFIDFFWSYYLNLENSFIRTTQYVMVDEKNYNTFSIEYIGLLQSICAEIDTVMKEICEFKQEDSKKISEYYDKIIKEPFFKDIINEETTYIYQKNEFRPFNNWNKETSPQWWKSYNNVKHERTIKYMDGNLKNVLNALSALYILERYKIKDIADKTNERLEIPEIDSKVFRLKKLKTRNINLDWGVIGEVF